MNRKGLTIIHNLRKIITGKAVKVVMYTLDHLVKKYGFNHVDIVQMDV